MAECVVCLEEVVRKLAICCPQCDTPIHPPCVQQHLLHTVLEPHCPSCTKDWSHEFLAGHLSKAWRLGVFKTHREGILLDRERSLLPDTQDAAAAIVMTRRLREERRRVKAELSPINSEFYHADRELRQLMRENKKRKDQVVVDLRERKRHLKLIIDELNAIVRAIEHNRYDLETRTIRAAEEVVVPPTKRRDFVYPCPAPECRGFLSTQWKCKICDLYTCSKCGDLLDGHSVVDDEPKCDAGTLASFQLIRKDTKGCPACGVPITKISGCDHMFCIDCKTAFSWKTGEIHPKGNTNPYYWQWVERRGPQAAVPREVGNPCGTQAIVIGIINHITLYRECGEMHLLMNLLHNLPHIEAIELRPHLQILNRDEYQPLRIRYILKEISEDEWRVAIQRVDKKQRKARFVVSILELFVHGSIDIVRRLESVKLDQEDDVIKREFTELSITLLSEVRSLQQLCNLELMKIGNMFSSTIYLIDDGFRIIRTH